MPDFIYAMETRLTPEQQKGVALVTEVARAHECNVYLTGGAIRDLVTGFPIRDLDFTIHGNPLKLQRDFEKAGAVVTGVDEDYKVLQLSLPGAVRAEIAMARSETYEKAGKGPSIAPATINEDLRRRDFTVNAMALSLNPGSRGLLLDPSNGMADIEAQVLRILHNYAFLEDPSRLIRATRFAARFHWQMEERTQTRYEAAKENNYIEYITKKAIGHEVEQLAYEEDPLNVMRALEKEGWLKVLNPHWTVAKVDSTGLAQVAKLRQQMAEFSMQPDTAPIVLHLLTRRMSDKEEAEIRRMIQRKELIEAWKNLEDDAKELGKKLSGKESATPSLAWKVLSDAKPELILFLELTGKQQAVTQKIGNFFGKWRQVKQKLPFPEMLEMRITPALPEYPQITEEAFLLLLDGKLRSHTEIVKFLKPFEPPPPPPPPAPVRRGRGAKAAAAAAGGAAEPGRPGRRRKRVDEDEEEMSIDRAEELEGIELPDEDEDEEVEPLKLGEEEEHAEPDEDEEEEEKPVKRVPAKTEKKESKPTAKKGKPEAKHEAAPSKAEAKKPAPKKNGKPVKKAAPAKAASKKAPPKASGKKAAAKKKR